MKGKHWQFAVVQFIRQNYRESGGGTLRHRDDETYDDDLSSDKIRPVAKCQRFYHASVPTIMFPKKSHVFFDKLKTFKTNTLHTFNHADLSRRLKNRRYNFSSLLKKVLTRCFHSSPSSPPSTTPSLPFAPAARVTSPKTTASWFCRWKRLRLSFVDGGKHLLGDFQDGTIPRPALKAARASSFRESSSSNNNDLLVR